MKLKLQLFVLLWSIKRIGVHAQIKMVYSVRNLSYSSKCGMICKSNKFEDVDGVAYHFPTYLGKIKVTLLARVLSLVSPQHNMKEYFLAVLHDHLNRQDLINVVAILN